MPVSAVFRSHYFNRFFAVLILGSFAIGVIAPFDGRAEDDGLGYKYTPQLPNSKWRVHDRNRPQAPKVVPGETPGAPPSDAVVLFDGTDFTQWEKTKAKNLGAESGDDALDRKLIQDGSFDIIERLGYTVARWKPLFVFGVDLYECGSGGPFQGGVNRAVHRAERDAERVAFRRSLLRECRTWYGRVDIQ